MIDALDKRAIVAALREKLSGELATLKRIAEEAAEGATHEENKPENDKDMRSTEASYIARGQAARAGEIGREISLLTHAELKPLREGEKIRVGALVALSHDDKVQVCFLTTAGGGNRVRVDGVEVQALSPTSPLGAALIGRTEGEEVELRPRDGTAPRGASKIYEIVRVR